ncbi:MAG TPA: MFS transporter [Kiritimatiellia bacterium]|nr:MFS transporter [Kiritimatiellia bacterium]OQC59172.1 MAG: Regulatory protein UhpC [Verrucomicrobia bacterium ADurb.Bin018]MBP9571940.1 MFS transporter [Kiritimatiellia bacterium]HOE01247.1 MFS transporter [Kiritimatiellia bacterium]HOE37366.1 MFS transporter [Kiritimatiellia bacterium]
MTTAPAKAQWKDAHMHPPGFRARRGLNWFTVGLLYATFYMCRYNFRFAGPGMREEFGFEAQQIADLAGWFSLAYGTGQLVNGLICDRIGGRASMLLGAIGTILLNIAIGFSPFISNFSAFAVLWMLNGYLQAAGTPGMVKINAAWFNRAERGVFAGIFGFMIQSGQTMISLLAPVILNGFTFLAFAVGPGNWRMLFCIPPIFVGLVAIWFYFISAPSPDEAGYAGTIHDDVDNSAGTTVRVWESFKFVFSNPLVWFYAVAYGCTGAVRHASDQLAPLYFEDVLGFNMKTNLPEIAVATLALIPMVAVAGSVLSGWVSDRFFRGHRYPVAMVLYFTEAVVIATAAIVMGLKLIGPTPAGILLGCLFLVLIAVTANSTHSIVGAAAPMDIGGKKMAGFASGVIDSFQYYGAAIGLFLTGRLLKVSDGNYTFWFGLMTCFAFFGGCAMLSLLLRQKGRQAASRSVIVFMILLVLGGLVFGMPKYRAQKEVHRARVAEEAAALAAAQAQAAEAMALADAQAAEAKPKVRKVKRAPEVADDHRWIAPAMDDDTFQKKATPKPKKKKPKKAAINAPAAPAADAPTPANP